MESLPLYKPIDALLEKLLKYRNLPETSSVVAKYFIIELGLAFLITTFFFIVAWALSAEIMMRYILTLSLVFLTWPCFFFVKKLEHVILFSKLYALTVIAFYVLKMGGILSSGGIIFLGVQTVLHTLIFKKFRWMFYVFGTFMVFLSMLFYFNPILPTDNLLSPKENLLFTFLNLAGITTYLLVCAMYAFKLFTGLEKKEAERQKELNDAKTRLYSNITHEFRTPLTVILGLADSMQANGYSKDSKIDTIIRNGKNLLQLVDQMLDLSRLESGNLTVNKIHGNIIPFLRYIFQLQEYYAQEKNLKMTFHAESQSYELDFDPEKTTTIVSNLLGNAIKFTPSGGEISMSVKALNGYISIIIKDNGIGIPEHHQDKIFERFYQTDDNNTRKAGGAGIGLALTKELITLLNGSIQLKSYPGIETTFTVNLPITAHLKNRTIPTIIKAPAEQQQLPDFHEKQKEKKHLLLVEDNQDVVEYLISCYQSMFKIDVANNGKKGLELAHKKIPDIIISDIMMPEMDGFELCKRLKEDYRTSHIPVILLTAKADIPSRIEGLEKGAEAYVVKPFNQQELLVRMQKLLELRTKLYQRYSTGSINGAEADLWFQKEDQFFDKLTDLIKENMQDEFFGVSTLCREMAMSKSQLYRKFKALTNKSVARYIKTLRMQKARQLLQTTNMNITEIAYEVGMKSLSTFSQLFKDEFGESPTGFIGHNQQKSPVS
ncbi:ATP-binding protein [Prolixibacteraceae bacterium Z1-6]|uniref:histidine kinase n=1 Tax=Draconibacterium aestuarii TaxID=2998507 RepID=A0A9X3F2V6_9BACT|nr:ATP-binding protein [Prolixibacteraceae bacterium Z1-6]